MPTAAPASAAVRFTAESTPVSHALAGSPMRADAEATAAAAMPLSSSRLRPPMPDRSRAMPPSNTIAPRGGVASRGSALTRPPCEPAQITSASFSRVTKLVEPMSTTRPVAVSRATARTPAKDPATTTSRVVTRSSQYVRESVTRMRASGASWATRRSPTGQRDGAGFLRDRAAPPTSFFARAWLLSAPERPPDRRRGGDDRDRHEGAAGMAPVAQPLTAPAVRPET